MKQIRKWHCLVSALLLLVDLFLDKLCSDAHVLRGYHWVFAAEGSYRAQLLSLGLLLSARGSSRVVLVLCIAAGSSLLTFKMQAASFSPYLCCLCRVSVCAMSPCSCWCPQAGPDPCCPLVGASPEHALSTELCTSMVLCLCSHCNGNCKIIPVISLCC